MIDNRIKFSLPLALLVAAMPSVASASETGAESEAPSRADMALSAQVGTDTAAMSRRTYMCQTVMAGGDVYNPQTSSWLKQVRASGSIQSEFHFNEYDPGIKNEHFDQIVRNQTYFDFTLSAPYVAIGARFEFAKWPLPGFSKQPLFEGWGVPYFWATGNYKGYQLTVGDFYEQFGSGFILRSYQDRSLGIDGALRGARLKMNPVNGLYITGLAGKQRFYWHHNPAWIWGGDVEWALDESFGNAFGSNYGLTLGASYTGKHQSQQLVYTDDNMGHLFFPYNEAGFDGRFNLRLHNFTILGEYATKNNAPNVVNNYTYGRGQAEMLSVTYSKKGFSAFLQGKRSENMSWLSDRTVNDVILNNGRIGFMPPFTMTQTYTLAAMYPYGTQYDGEWAFQGELRYLFKKGTPLGGKYGTNVRLSASYISGLDWNTPTGKYTPVRGTNGPGSAFWKIGALYYADLNFEINKKFNKHLQFTLFYLFQKYSMEYIRKEAEPMITANIFILEGQWKIKSKTQLRWELQYLTTKQDQGDWMCGLVELSLAPHWMFTFTDTYNNGTTKKNYFKGMITYNYKANRFTLGYGRTREGYDCSGGVCRTVPSTKGFSLTYNYTF
ncbi:MAG: DUF6029 family protein [Muribaculum sp.]|nr:DUF6029 family protein [Muribaculum sp.]